MSVTEIVMGVVGGFISILIGVVGYLLNRQLTNVDTKLVQLDTSYFELKKEVMNLDKSPASVQLSTTAIKSEIMATKVYLKAEIDNVKKSVENVDKRQIEFMSESRQYFHRIEEFEEEKKETDALTKRLYDVVKELVERTKRRVP